MAVTGAVVVRSLCKSYGDRSVLRGINLEIGHGEVVALLGPNGAGKTTTIEILEGYRQPTAGLVRVLGLDPWAHPVELRQRVGVVLQECGFPNALRVGELLDAWRSYYERPRPMGELLELVELGGEERTLVRRLSGGQRRRLDFALALAGDPEVIFLDEPTTGFDPEARRRCWAAIENLASLDKTILLTTHYLDEAERLAHRVAIVADGCIRAVGSARDLACLAQAPTCISFRLGQAANGAADLLGQLRAEQHGDRVTIHTHEPSMALQRLIRSQGDLVDLMVAPPTLEDSYLALVAAADKAAP